MPFTRLIGLGVIVSSFAGAPLTARASDGAIYAALEAKGDFDRYVIHFSAPSPVRAIQICEPNVRWSCEANGRYRGLVSEVGPSGRAGFKSSEAVLLWDKKKIYARLQYVDGRRDLQILQVTQKKQVFTGDLKDPKVGDAKPNPSLVGKACVFAFSPLPEPDANGERGATYPTHRTSRDYDTPDDTPLYSMGTCEVVKRIDTGTEHPCGFGIAMRCQLADKIMGVLYCHLSRPAEHKRFFGIGELVGHSGHSGTDNPHLHLGLTFDVYDHQAPRPPGLEDEELLMPGLPVADNNPDRWLDEHGCYQDPAGQRVSYAKATPAVTGDPIVGWDGLSFVGNDVWAIGDRS